MCTVTFVPVKDGCFIASNRDEKLLREPALRPQWYRQNGTRVLYPRDAKAGGTWIALKQSGDAAVLLNGGFVKHEARPPYRKSRGLVFLDIAAEENPVEAFAGITLHNIEPFTLVLYNNGALFECRWDGDKRHVKLLNSSLPHIWSSVTLYDNDVIEKRESWFDAWLKKHPQSAVEDVLNFHRFAGDGDAANDIRMSRDGIYSTVSITVMQLANATAHMHYLDLKNNKSFNTQIEISSMVAV